MRFFILSIYFLFDKLDELLKSIDKTIQKRSVDLITETEVVVNEIFALNDKRRIVVNLQTMYQLIFETLSKSEHEMLTMYCRKASLDDLSLNLGISKTTLLRRLNKALSTATSALIRAGVTKEKVETEYKTYAPVALCMKRLMRAHKLSTNLAIAPSGSGSEGIADSDLDINKINFEEQLILSGRTGDFR